MSTEMLKAVEQIGGAFNELKSVHDRRLSEIQDRLERVEATGDRPRDASASVAASKDFADMLRTGRGIPSMEGKTMSGATAADGGALVPELIAANIVDQALATGGIANEVTVTQTPTSDYVRLLNMRGQEAAWVAEAATRTATANLQLREVRPPSGELYAAVTVTNFLLNDSQFDVAAMVTRNAVQQFARSLESAVYNGNGTSKPEGILYGTAVTTTDDASPRRASTVIQKVIGASDIASNLISGFFTLKPEYRKGAIWVMSSASLAAVRKLRDSNGSGFLWQANMGVGVDSTDGTLLGKRVVTCEDMTTITDGSPQALGVLVGDLKQGYELIQIGPMTVLRDPYSARGFTTFYLAVRFGGRLIDNDSIKVIAT